MNVKQETQWIPQQLERDSSVDFFLFIYKLKLTFMLELSHTFENDFLRIGRNFSGFFEQCFQFIYSGTETGEFDLVLV